MREKPLHTSTSGTRAAFDGWAQSSASRQGNPMAGCQCKSSSSIVRKGLPDDEGDISLMQGITGALYEYQRGAIGAKPRTVSHHRPRICNTDTCSEIGESRASKRKFNDTQEEDCHHAGTAHCASASRACRSIAFAPVTEEVSIAACTSQPLYSALGQTNAASIVQDLADTTNWEGIWRGVAVSAT